MLLIKTKRKIDTKATIDQNIIFLVSRLFDFIPINTRIPTPATNPTLTISSVPRTLVPKRLDTSSKRRLLSTSPNLLKAIDVVRYSTTFNTHIHTRSDTIDAL